MRDWLFNGSCPHGHNSGCCNNNCYILAIPVSLLASFFLRSVETEKGKKWLRLQYVEGV